MSGADGNKYARAVEWIDEWLMAAEQYAFESDVKDWVDSMLNWQLRVRAQREANRRSTAKLSDDATGDDILAGLSKPSHAEFDVGAFIDVGIEALKALRRAGLPTDESKRLRRALTAIEDLD